MFVEQSLALPQSGLVIRAMLSVGLKSGGYCPVVKFTRGGYVTSRPTPSSISCSGFIIMDIYGRSIIGMPYTQRLSDSDNDD